MVRLDSYSNYEKFTDAQLEAGLEKGGPIEEKVGRVGEFLVGLGRQVSLEEISQVVEEVKMSLLS